MVRTSETDNYYEPILFAYNSLYLDITREYDTIANTDRILDECLAILIFISKSVL